MDSSEEIEITGSDASEDDDVVVEVGEEGGGSSLEGTRDEEFPFQVLSTEQVVQHMGDSIREANLVLQLSPTTTRSLLTHFRWDKEKLLEAYCDAADLDSLFREARVANPAAGSRTSSASVGVASCGGVDEDCDICFTRMPSPMMYGLEECGHRFCLQCWSHYLTTKIQEEGMSQTIPCAAHNCSVLVDDASVMRLVMDPGVRLKYQILTANSFVECNRLMKWCPSVDCSNAVLVEWLDWKPVSCTCGHTFCFQCGNNWHVPVECDWLRKWLKRRVVAESEMEALENLSWIAVNTKECPKCAAPIEKNGGCNHMSCRKCGTDFCWACLQPFSSHGSCNVYQGPPGTSSSTLEKLAALRRYSFYFQRYENHNQSLKFEKELYAAVSKKMEELQEELDMSSAEVQFLKKAVDVLCQCRQTLMHSYVFAFYLQRCCQSEIFEDNQAYFESAIESLSEYLEREITSEDLADIKQKVHDKYRYCESRRQVLLDHVYEGWEKEWWQHSEQL